MDKESLSTYGWVIIVAIILSLLLIFATPFGNYAVNGINAIPNILGNSFGWGDSDSSGGETDEIITLSAPTILVDGANLIISGSSAAEGYTIYVDGSSVGNVNETVIDLNELLTEYDLGTYAIKVQAYAEGNAETIYSDYSNEVEFTITLSAPTISINEDELTITANSDLADGYEIYSDDDLITTKTSTTADLMSVLAGLELGTHTVKVRAYREIDGNIFYSAFSNELDYYLKLAAPTFTLYTNGNYVVEQTRGALANYYLLRIDLNSSASADALEAAAFPPSNKVIYISATKISDNILDAIGFLTSSYTITGNYTVKAWVRVVENGSTIAESDYSQAYYYTFTSNSSGSGSGSNSGSNQNALKAGLYSTGTTTMTKTWDELLDEGILIYTEYGGEIRVATGKEALLAGDLVLPDTVEHIEYKGFVDCTKLTNVATLRDSGITYGKYAFQGCTALTNIPDFVTYIHEGLFYGCTSLKNVIIPNVNTTIERYAFYGCTNLENITLPSTLKIIDRCAFYNCSSLETIEIPNGVTVIGEYAFSDCSSLSNIVIPEGVEEISNYTFYNCTKLQTITIPKTVTAINDRAFTNCTMLKTITYTGIQEQWDVIDISMYSGLDDTHTVVCTGIVTN